MSDILTQYEQSIENIIGKERVIVRLIHNGKDLCINSKERELLETIQNTQQRDHGVDWNFQENMFGMAITLPVKQLVSPSFTAFAEEYKVRFQNRIQMILNKYDKKPLEQEKKEFYEQVKMSYFALNDRSHVDFDEYKNIRDMFQRVRN